jgi:hypothetical protein
MTVFSKRWNGQLKNWDKGRFLFEMGMNMADVSWAT